MRNNLRLILLIAIAFFATALYGQTGKFSVQIPFMSQNRLVAFYVPDNYDSTQKYSLFVGLHGLGDNSENYRNALISSLRYDTLFKNTIFIFPEANTVNSDYFMPAGGEEIISESIKYTVAEFNIDESSVYLQGFSLGGRAALRYALNNPAKFKGVILNTPAVQGVKESGNRSFYKFNYQNASALKIYLTIGRMDDFYNNIADSVFRQLVLHNANVKFKPIISMGHTVPNPLMVSDLPAFFDDPFSAQNNIDIVDVKMPLYTCDNKFSANVLIRNFGEQEVTQTVISYFVNGVENTYMHGGIIQPFQHEVITINDIAVTNRNNTVEFIVKTVNGSADEIAELNSKTENITKFGNGLNLPFAENFESSAMPPQGWFINKSGDVVSEWGHSVNAGKNFGAAFSVNTILVFDNLGAKEELITPALNLSSLPNPNLRFNVSYNYHRYTPPYLNVDTAFADTLEVLVSTDCGQNFNRIFKKGGKELASFGKPMTNITNLNSLFPTPKDTNWGYFALDLSPYASANKAIIKFGYISALGGIIYLDNILVGNNSLAIADKPINDLKIYPNPANNMVNFSSENEPLKLVEFTDISGRVVLTEINNSGSSDFRVNTSGLKPGMYVVKMHGNNIIQTAKLLISR